MGAKEKIGVQNIKKRLAGAVGGFGLQKEAPRLTRGLHVTKAARKVGQKQNRKVVYLHFLGIGDNLQNNVRCFFTGGLFAQPQHFAHFFKTLRLVAVKTVLLKKAVNI